MKKYIITYVLDNGSHYEGVTCGRVEARARLVQWLNDGSPGEFRIELAEEENGD
jgi:hypothetical protein